MTIKDITGLTFGKLTALKIVNITKNGYCIWRCRCECGNIVDVRGTSLRSKNTKSCGCYKKELDIVHKDFSGQRFGRLLVVKEAGKSKHGYIWKCKCDCGKETEILGASLVAGISRSCGCLQKEKVSKANLKDLTGKTFGYIKVIEYVDNSYWIGKCKCGNIKEFKSSSLISGASKSCGCYNLEMLKKIQAKKIKDISGNRYGHLTIIEMLKDRTRRGRILWKCKCDCGNIIEVESGNLKNGHTKSCGCISESYIASKLKEYFIKYYSAISEYKEFINPHTNYPLPYDIYVPKYKFYIEIQGHQHYQYVSRFHKDVKDLEYQKEKDRMKKKHAKKNGTFIEIDLRKNKTVEEWIDYIKNIIEDIEK